MDGANLNWSIDYYEANLTKCNETLKGLQNFNKIPLLLKDNLHHFKDGDLVRYQGMVQDMLNPEYYYPNYSIKNSVTGESTNVSGKYRDIAPCQENEELDLDGKSPAMRLLFFCIPIPAMSCWVQDHLKDLTPVHTPYAILSNNKRSMEEDEADNEMVIDDEASSSQDFRRNKKLAGDVENGRDSSSVSHSSDKYFPLSDMTGLPCIVKIYEDEDKCDIVLNDRIEIIGFLSVNPALENSLDDSDMEQKAMNPPPSLVPRIHAVYNRKLSHSNPLLDQNIDFRDIEMSAEKIRSDLHLVLTQILYGDNLAADYLICYLLSRIYGRSEDQALGKFCLNICNVKAATYGRRLFNVIEKLVTNCQYIPLTVEALNEKSFVPKKDYESNRLWSGRLQMCDDTHLILDETRLKEGKLDPTGCLNVAALQNLIREQQIRYDFSYYSVKYNTNIPVLIFSDGKSIFEADIRVKLKPEPSVMDTIEETLDAAAVFLNDEICQRIRVYLTSMRLQQFEMREEMIKKIGDDYVRLRQQNNKINSYDLHNLLVLSRLLAVSYGRKMMTNDDWSRALEMDTERRNRFL